MAIPSGSGTEVLRRGTVNALTNTQTALDFSGAAATTVNQVTNVVPTNHIITLLNISFTEVATASGETIRIHMVPAGTSTIIHLLLKQPLGVEQTFIYGEKIVLTSGDQLQVYMSDAAVVDVHYSYIDQDWS